MSNDTIKNLVPGLSARVDYLTFTVWSNDYPLDWIKVMFPNLGDFREIPHGARAYKRMAVNPVGATVYFEPSQPDKDGGYMYFSVELKGAACATLLPDELAGVEFLRRGHVRIQYTRLDLAVDNLPFTPNEFFTMVDRLWCADTPIDDQELTCKASREAFRIENSPHQKQDEGDGIGCQTVYIGKRVSDRFARVYNKHGFTRFELVLKKKWADEVAKSLLVSSFETWVDFFIGCIRSYIDITNNPIWDSFIQSAERSDIRVYSARSIIFRRSQKWIEKQVAPTAFAYISVVGLNAFLDLVMKAEERARKNRSEFLIQADIEGINRRLELTDHIQKIYEYEEIR